MGTAQDFSAVDSGTMIRRIAPVLFTTDIPATVFYHEEKLGFQSMGRWQDPPVYAMDSTKVVQGVVLPNNPNVLVLAAMLLP